LIFIDDKNAIIKSLSVFIISVKVFKNLSILLTLSNKKKLHDLELTVHKIHIPEMITK